MPAHLRWELYPIPKGPRERQRYGGSYFEESDWWTKPPNTSHKSEAAFVLKEVLLLRACVGELSRIVAVVVAPALGTVLVSAGHAVCIGRGFATSRRQLSHVFTRR